MGLAQEKDAPDKIIHNKKNQSQSKVKYDKREKEHTLSTNT